MISSDWSCADICDAKGDDGVLYPDSFPFRHFSKCSKFFGQIRTVSCFEDNSRVKEILATEGKGYVLVVDGQASQKRALLGDLIAGSAVTNNWSGVLINGAIRDAHAVSMMEHLGVVALGTNPRKSERKGQGLVDVDVTFNEVTFRPADWIYVDTDGFIVSRSKL